MFNLARLFLAAVLFVGTGAAHAVMVDFVAAADSGGYGESAWSPLSLKNDFGVDVNISGVKGVAGVFAYLDSGGAGLGVCGDVPAGANVKRPGLTSNLCNPSNDDNVTAGESLLFQFNEDVTIEKLWFNNNHDSNFSLMDPADLISIFGVNYGPGTPIPYVEDPSREFLAGHPDVLLAKEFSFLAGEQAFISFVNEQFYLSAMKIRRDVKVPEPMTLGLLGFGLIGLGFARRTAIRS